MARPRSEDKRSMILDAAITVFAERGVWSTPTSAISRVAGVAEGTLFNYFATKDVLVNELYRALKLELADVLLSGFPREADTRDKFFHVWSRYVRWGVGNPAKLKVMTQLGVSEQISAESRALGYAPLALLEQEGKAAIEQGIFGAYPLPFIAATLNTLAEMTMGFVTPSDDIDYLEAGFEVFWQGVTRH